MTEQELRQELGEAIKSAGIPEGQVAFDLKQKILVAAKAYADARESKEIEELKAQVDGLKTDMQHSRLIEAVQVKEANELNAEIKRLRDALLWLKENRTPDRAMIEVFIDKALSPAPVTETQNEDQS